MASFRRLYEELDVDIAYVGLILVLLAATWGFAELCERTS